LAAIAQISVPELTPGMFGQLQVGSATSAWCCQRVQSEVALATAEEFCWDVFVNQEMLPDKGLT
jgi:hypothetical protein